MDLVQWVTGVEKQTLGIPFEPFRKREHNSEFLSVQQKIEKIFRNAVPFRRRETNSTKRGSQIFQK
jgi:hypothetical protein